MREKRAAFLGGGSSAVAEVRWAFVYGDNRRAIEEALFAEHVAEHEVAEEGMLGETEETEDAEGQEENHISDEGKDGEEDVPVVDTRKRTFWHGGFFPAGGTIGHGSRRSGVRFGKSGGDPIHFFFCTSGVNICEIQLYFWNFYALILIRNMVIRFFLFREDGWCQIGFFFFHV